MTNEHFTMYPKKGLTVIAPNGKQGITDGFYVTQPGGKQRVAIMFPGYNDPKWYNWEDVKVIKI